jgi:hypothetical protein
MSTDTKLEDLQAVSSHVVSASERIARLEEEKRHVDPGSERFRSLSDEIEALAEEIRGVSHAETGLAQDVAGQHGLPTVAEADKTTGD